MIKEPFGISDACNKKILLPLLFIIHFGFIASHLQSVKIFSEGAQDFSPILYLTLLWLGLIKINDVSANFNIPRPSLILNN